MASGEKKAAKKAPKKAAKKPANSRKKSQKKPAAHGTRTRYVNEKCRCPRCKKANRDYHAKLEAKKRKATKDVPRGPKLNATEQSIRDTLIVTRKAQNWPWEAIAKEVGLSKSATEAAYRRKLESMPSLLELDAKKILEGLIEGLQFSIGDLEQLAVASVEERNMPAAVSAKKAANEAREKLQTLLQTTGILPHDLGTFRHQFEFRVVVVEVVNLVHTFVQRIEAIDLPEDKRPLVQEAAGELTAGLEQIDGSPPSANGDSDVRPQETAAAGTAGG